MNTNTTNTLASVSSTDSQPTLDDLQPEVRGMKLRSKKTYIDPDEQEFVESFVTDRAQIGDIWDE